MRMMLSEPRVISYVFKLTLADVRFASQDDVI